MPPGSTSTCATIHPPLALIKSMVAATLPIIVKQVLPSANVEGRHTSEETMILAQPETTVAFSGRQSLH